MKTVEISGIKLEIDELTTRTVESYRVGDKVKVLVKSYGDTYDIYPGAITGFAPFEVLPSIEVLYVKTGFTTDTDPFVMKAVNAKTEGLEIVPLNDLELLVDRDAIVRKFDHAIVAAEAKLDDMCAKRTYFVKHFARAFETPTHAE